MSTSPNSNVTAIRRHLQRCLKRLVDALPDLSTTEKNSERIIGSLANLLEQRECTQRVEKSSMTLLTEFPDMKEKLLSKLSQDVDCKVEALKENLQPLKEQKDLLGQSKEELWSLLSNHAQGPDFDALEASSPTVPPLAMMLDWVDTAERQIRELYCARVHYLDDLAEQTLVNSENLASLWKEDVHLLLETLSDCKSHVKFFLEEKI